MKNAILFHIFLLCICCMACTGTTKEPVADVTLDELPSIFPRLRRCHHSPTYRSLTLPIVGAGRRSNSRAQLRQ